MSIIKADLSHLEIVKMITITTISAIYPHYYPKGVVNFFLKHHSEDKIIHDIMQNRIALCLDSEQNVVGTVTINTNEICRLFVLPDYQGNGYGEELLRYAERMIFSQYSEITLSASLPAKGFYLKRGYQEIAYNMIKTENNDFLCYDEMIKIKILEKTI